MPEQINQNSVFTLKEVALSVQRTLKNRYQQSFWVKAEINRLNFYPQSGHCYPDLLQKEEGKVVAQMRAMIWSDDFSRISQNFVNATGEPLKDHINIMFLASIQFDPNYGLSLRIHDIDSSYSLGELEKEKLANIEILKKEGILNRNKSIEMPLLPKRLAIISVASSKGYADFIQLLENRMKGFVIEHFLFSSVLQGEKALQQIIHRLDQIENLSQHFDVVAIIRGGGGDIGLSVFNHITLARKIANFRLPVITGIGHATNLTVAEIVAHTNAITPSELADLLLERFETFIQGLNRHIQQLSRALDKFKIEQHHLEQLMRQLNLSAQNTLMHSERQQSISIQQFNALAVHILSGRAAALRKTEGVATAAFDKALDKAQQQLTNQCFEMKRSAQLLVSNKRQQLDISEHSVQLMHPMHVLKRGYSISRFNGKAVRNAEELSLGSEFETILLNGRIRSKVINSNTDNKNE